MKEISVSGKKRTETGKKASKLLRKEGLIPCNLYGEAKGKKHLKINVLNFDIHAYICLVKL